MVQTSKETAERASQDAALHLLPLTKKSPMTNILDQTETGTDFAQQPHL
jgi:hypothetical protein